MNRHEYYAGPDWWSRLMSFGALIAALAALYFGWLGSQKAGPSDEQFAQSFGASLDSWNQRVGDEINAIRTKTEEELGASRSRFASLLAELDQRGTERGGTDVASHSEPVDAHSEPVDDSTVAANDSTANDAMDLDAVDLADPNRLFGDEQDPILSGSNDSESNEIASSTDDGAEPASPSLPIGPKLLVVQTAAYRAEEGGLHRAVVANSGNAVAIIDEVYFVPQQEVRVALDVGSRPVEDASAQLARISFGRTDNSSKRSGAHGAYRRELATPVRLQPGDELEIDIEILNRDHKGWGLLGQLTLVSGSETVAIEDATAVFRDVEDS